MRGKVLEILILAAAADLFIAAFPVWVIRPFVAQPPRALALAMALRDHGAWVTVAGLVVIAICAAWLLARRRPGYRWTVAASMVALAIGAGSVFITHVDYFQWMFHPDWGVGAIPIAQAHWPPSAMVLDVSIRGQARAYPIREMGYYHVVNDRLGGDPIAATY